MHSTHNIEDGYLGSGKHLSASIKKYGTDAHVREIIEFCKDRESLCLLESQIVNENMIQDPMCMNIVIGGKGGAQSGEKNSFFGKHHSQKTINKIRLAMTGEKGPAFGRRGALHPMFGKKHSVIAKKKMQKAHVGKSWSKQQKIARKKSDDKRKQNTKKLDTKIMHMLLEQHLTRQEIAQLLNISINRVYGATHRHNLGMSGNS